jgi:hypothetical protein
VDLTGDRRGEPVVTTLPPKDVAQAYDTAARIRAACGLGRGHLSAVEARRAAEKLGLTVTYGCTGPTSLLYPVRGAVVLEVRIGMADLVESFEVCRRLSAWVNQRAEVTPVDELAAVFLSFKWFHAYDLLCWKPMRGPAHIHRLIELDLGTEWTSGTLPVLCASALRYKGSRRLRDYSSQVNSIAQGFREEGDARWALYFYRRTLRAARIARFPSMCVLSLVGAANVYIMAGKLRSAARRLRTALRIVERHGLRSLRGRVYHDLMVVAARRGRFRVADKLALEAFGAYASADAWRVGRLLNDVAVRWMEEGALDWAAGAMQQAFDQAAGRGLVVLHGTAAKLAGLRGDRAAYLRAAEAVFSDHHAEEVFSVYALLDVADGAWALNEWGRGIAAAERLLEYFVDSPEHPLKTFGLPRDVQDHAKHILDACLAQSPRPRTEVTLRRGLGRHTRTLIRLFAACDLQQRAAA